MYNYRQQFYFDKSTNLLNLAGKAQTVFSNSNKLASADYDASGNQLEMANKKVTYNHQGQTLMVEWPLHIEYYTYANSGQRIKKVSETQDVSGLTTQVDIVLYVGGTEYRSSFRGTNLVYDGQTVVDLQQEIRAQSSTAQTRVKSGHGQLAKVTKDIQQEETTYVYNLLNHLDNNSGVLDAQSQFKSYQAYYPYGKTASSQGNTNNKQLGFSGQELDGTGFNYYGYRYYDSSMGRWTRPDPLGMQGSGLNLYAMTGGNPVTFRDQRGLDFDKIIRFIIGFLDLKENSIESISREVLMNMAYFLGYFDRRLLDVGDEISIDELLDHFENFAFATYPEMRDSQIAMHYLANARLERDKNYRDYSGSIAHIYIDKKLAINDHNNLTKNEKKELTAIAHLGGDKKDNVCHYTSLAYGTYLDLILQEESGFDSFFEIPAINLEINTKINFNEDTKLKLFNTIIRLKEIYQDHYSEHHSRVKYLAIIYVNPKSKKELKGIKSNRYYKNAHRYSLDYKTVIKRDIRAIFRKTYKEVLSLTKHEKVSTMNLKNPSDKNKVIIIEKNPFIFQMHHKATEGPFKITPEEKDFANSSENDDEKIDIGD